MTEILVYIFYIVVVMGLVYLFVGIPYIKDVEEMAKEKAKELQVFNKQSYVRNNLNKFGINDGEGSELKRNQVHAVSYEKMGF